MGWETHATGSSKADQGALEVARTRDVVEASTVSVMGLL